MNGPDLPAAIAAANPGDVLLVTGDYLSFTPLVIGKPLFLHGTNASILAPTTIQNIPAGATMVVQNFTCSLSVRGCAGRVLLAGLTGSNISVDGCSEVAITDSVYGDGVGGAFSVSASTVLLSQCRGLGSRLGGLPTPGLSASRAQVFAADCEFTGGNGNRQSNLPTAGIVMDASTIRLSGTCRVAAGEFSTGPENAVDGTGVLRHSSATVFVPRGGIDVAAGIARSVLDLPTTAVTRSDIGGIGTVALQGGAGHAFALLGLLPGPPATFSGVDGELWLSGVSVIAQGTLDGRGGFALSFLVPDAPVLRAIVFRWQGLTSDGVRVRLAEPATECHS